MNQATNNLVQTEAASSFLLLATTETGRKAFLGAPEKFDGSVGPDITNAHIALRDGVDTIARLLKDETRSGVQRHEVAGVMTARTAIEALQKAKAAIESYAVRWRRSTGRTRVCPACQPCQPLKRNPGVHPRTGEAAERPAKVRAAMLESKDVAAVIFHSPGFLVGINPETHSKRWKNGFLTPTSA